MTSDKISIFDLLYEPYKIQKPIRMIELFGGYGSQSLALKYLGVKYEHHKLVEWAIPSIIAYADLHRNELEYYGNDFCGDLSKEQICNELFKMGVSADYNKPCTLDQLKRMKEDKLRLVYNSIMCSNNLVDISRVKGEELRILDQDHTYIMTYSFPCQDLSVAGQRKGMADGTRSGLLWQVERILTECKELERANKGYMPNVLLMENVIQVHSEKDMEHFRKWINRLEELGYQNYWQDLIATDYGIPQTRNRCFMVSIYGDYSYTFPKPKPLKLRLKDLLEKEVDEKYFLSDKLLKCFMSDGTGKYPRKERFLQNLNKKNQDVAGAITTLEGNRATDNFIKITNLRETIENVDLSEVKETSFIDGFNRTIRNDGNAGTIDTGVNERNTKFLLIKNNNAKGYLEATDGDGVDISGRMEHHRGTVQKGKCQTITTGGADVGVVINVKK